MRHVFAAMCVALAAASAGASPRKQIRSQPASPDAPRPAPPQSGVPSASTPPRPTAPPAPVPPRRFGRFDVDQPLSQLRTSPDLTACAEQLAHSSGRAECLLPKDADRLERAQLAWEEGKNGGEIIALRLVFDPQTAPPLTDLEWQLTRGWGPPVLEQLRRERDQKFFTLQWEDAEHRATLEAQGAFSQPSRAVAVVLERRQAPLAGELATLHPRPFPSFRARAVRKLDWEGPQHVVVWGTSLTPAQDAMGESSPAWTSQRNYVGVWRLEAATATRPRRWRPLWERTTGGDDEEEWERILRVGVRDLTGDGTADVEVELSCQTCGSTASELIVKTMRAGKLVDLLVKRELYRAQIELRTGQVRIREPEGENDQDATVTTYAYDRGKGAFVLAREERVAAPR